MSPQVWPPRPPRILRGTVSGITNAVYTPVSFPAGFFTETPTVVVVGVQTNANAYISSSISTAGFSVAIATASPQRVDWIAVQA